MEVAESAKLSVTTAEYIILTIYICGDLLSAHIHGGIEGEGIGEKSKSNV